MEHMHKQAMKKILALFLTVTMSLAILSCGEISSETTRQENTLLSTEATTLITNQETTVSYEVSITVEGQTTKVMVPEGTKLPTQVIPTKENYTFLGWYLDGNLYDFDVPVTSNIALVARFTINTQIITLITMNSEIEVEVAYGALMKDHLPTPESFLHYEFDQWYLDENHTIPLENQIVSDHDVTLYANYVPVDYSLTFEETDGTLIYTEEIAYGTDLSNYIYPQPPVVEGYTFNNWNPILPSSMPGENLVLTGTYTLNSYDLDYYVNGEVVKTVTYDYGEAIHDYSYLLPAYDFFGWYTTNDFQTLNTLTNMPSRDVALYGYTVEQNIFYLPTEHVSIEFWHSFIGVEASTLNALITEFESEYPNIDIESVYKENLETEMINAYESDTLPDIFIANDYFIYQVSTIPMLENLELLMTSNLGIDVSDIETEYYHQTLSIGDGLNYSLPFVSNNEVVLYNKDLFDLFDLTIPEEFTFDTLNIFANRLVGEAENQCQNLMYHSDLTNAFLSLFNANDDLDVTLTTLKTMANNHVIVTNEIIEDPLTAFRDGALAMVTIDASEIASYLALNPDFEIGVTEVFHPATSDASVYTDLISFGITLDLDEDELVSAWLLAKYLFSPKNQAAFTIASYLAPTNSNTFLETTYTDLSSITETSNVNYLLGQVLKTLEKENTMLINAPYQTLTIQYFKDAMDEYLFGDKTVSVIQKEVFAYIPELDLEFDTHEVTRFLWVDQPVMVEENLILPDGFEVYRSSDYSYIDRGGIVNRPSSFIGDTLVRVEIRKTTELYQIFCEFYMIVKAEAPLPVNTNIETVINNYEYFKPVNVMGYITNFQDGGFYVSDGLNAIFIYYSDEDYSPTIGDLVFAEGVYTSYGVQQYRISNIVHFELVEKGDGVNILNAISKELSEIDVLNSDSHIYIGRRYTITGEIVVDNNSGFKTVSINDGTYSIDFGRYADESGINALRNQETNVVTIEVFISDVYSQGEVQLGFNGTYKDVIIVENNRPNLTEEVASLKDALPDTVSDDFTLPSVTEYGAVISNWESSNPSVISNTGKVNPTNTTVTLTALVTLEDDTLVLTKDIDVVAGDTIQVALLKKDNTEVAFTGVVYFKYNANVYLSENNYFIVVSNPTLYNEANIGDLVEVDGRVVIDSNNDMRTIVDSTYQIISSNNTLPMPKAVTEDDFLDGSILPGTPIVFQAEFIETSWIYHLGYFVFNHGFKIDLINVAHEDHYLSNYYDQHHLYDAVYYNGTDGLIYQRDQSSLLYDALSDTEILDILFSAIDIEEYKLNDNNIKLPNNHITTSTLLIKTTPDSDLLNAYDGHIYPVKGEVSVISIDLSITIGEVTRTETYAIHITDANTINTTSIIDLLHAEQNSLVRVLGVITSFRDDTTIFMQDEFGNPLVIYVNWADNYPELNVGDVIEIYGTFHLQDFPEIKQMSDIVYLEVISSNHELYVDKSYSAVEISSSEYYELVYGRRLAQVFTILELEDFYGYTVLEGEDYNLIFIYEGLIPLEDLYEVGDTVYIEFTYSTVYGGEIIIIDVLLPDYQIADKFDYVESKILLPTVVYGDFDLPTENQEMSASISWTSSNPSIISNLGVVTPNATSDISVTLTAEIYLDNAYRSSDFIVIVKQEKVSYTNVLSLDTNELEGNIVAFEGNVLAVLNEGYLLTDGVHAIYVTSDRLDIATNSLVKVIGVYQNSSFPKISEIYVETVLNEGDGVFPLAATPITINELYYTVTNDDFYYGYVYTVTGSITYSSGEILYVYGVDGDLGAIEITALSPEASFDLLTNRNGDTITIDIIFAYKDGLTSVYFIGGESDISTPSE